MEEINAIHAALPPARVAHQAMVEVTSGESVPLVESEEKIVTALEVVQQEGRKILGEEISDKDADWILWEHTGFPCFWPDRTASPEENLRRQVREFLQNVVEKRKRRKQ